MKKYYIYIAVLMVASLALVGYSYAITSGPDTDSRIVDDLNQIDSDISNYASGNNSVPDTLAQLNDQSQLMYNINTYTYTSMGYAYRICATFRSDNTSQGSQQPDDPTYHHAGSQCFTHDEGATAPIQPGRPIINNQ